MSKAIDTDQSVALMVVKVTIQTENLSRICQLTPTYNDHVMISSHLVHVNFILQHIIILHGLAVFNYNDYEREGRNGWKAFNRFEELEPSA